jgi:F0F1-type ATP synthase membrane subunit b/b'
MVVGDQIGRPISRTPPYPPNTAEYPYVHANSRTKTESFMPSSGGRHRLSRRTKIATGALALAIAGGALTIAMTVGDPNAANAASGGQAAAGQITCPDVASKLPAIPAQAQAEVTRNLDLLNTQIAEANNRLQTTVGQGGPNFVQNAILGPLADKRKSTIDRIAISIGRRAEKPQGLDSLATCSVGGQSGTGAGAGAPAPAQGTGNGGQNGNNGQNGNTGNTGNTGNAGVGAISCPDVASKLPAIPAQAQAEVTRNLELLNTQIAEANNRLQTTVGQGGPNFVQNAILGPLEDKRVATINRIATAIGRNAAKPQGLDALAPCSR